MFPCDVIKARLMIETPESGGNGARGVGGGQSTAHGTCHSHTSATPNCARTSRPSSIRGACAAVVRDHGFLGLYRGLGVTLLKAVPVNAAGMTLLASLRNMLGVSSS